MKNLKKILSVALVVVMLVGMMIVPVSAADTANKKLTYADLTDKDAIINKAEVALLVDLGIIQGTGDNKYDPTGLVNRAVMAKFVTLLTMKNVDDNLIAQAKAKFEDTNGHWGEGYIAYASQAGVVAGIGGNKFAPDDTVTLAQACKMLLVALGYNAESQGLVGDEWMLNTMALAASNNLLAGIQVNSNAALDRDTAAKLIYNTLFAQQVTYSTLLSAYTAKNNTLGLDTYGLMKVTATVTAADKDTVTVDPKSTIPAGYQNSVAKSYDLGNQEAFAGKSVVYYVTVDTKQYTENFLTSTVPASPLNDKLLSSELTLDNSTLKSSHNGTKLDADNLLKGMKADSTVTYYVNGAAVSGEAIDDAIALVAKKGVIVNINDNDKNGKYDMIEIINYSYGKISSVGSTEIKLTGFADSKVKIANIVTDTTDMEKDSIVYGYKIGDKYVLYVADALEGKITAIAKSENSPEKYSIDGTAYTLGAAGTTQKIGSIEATVGKTIIAYLDNNNYIVGWGEVKDLANDFGFVSVAEGISSAAFDGQRIKMVDLEGNITVGTIGTVDGKKLKNIGTDTAPNLVYGDEAKNTPANKIAGKAWKYSVDENNVYALKTIAGQQPINYSADAAKATVFTNGKTSFEYDNTNTFTVSSSTIIVDVDNNKTYTGFNGLPTVTVAAGKTLKGAAVQVDDEKGATDSFVAKYVFMTSASMTNENKKSVLIYNPLDYIKYDGYYTFEKAVVDGVEGPVAVTEDFFKTIVNVEESPAVLQDGVPYMFFVKTAQVSTKNDVELIADVDALAAVSGDDQAMWGILDTETTATEGAFATVTSVGADALAADGNYSASEDTVYFQITLKVEEVKDEDGNVTTKAVKFAVESADFESIEKGDLVFVNANDKGVMNTVLLIKVPVVEYV